MARCAFNTVNDEVDGKPLVVVAMVAAFAKAGHKVEPDAVTKYRGALLLDESR